MKLISLILAVLIISCSLTNTQRPLPKDTQKAVDNYLQLSQAYYQRKQYEQALNPLKRAYHINSNSSAVCGMFALVYQELGEIKTARKYFKEALSKPNKTTGIRNNYAIFLLENGEHDTAYEEFSKAVADLAYPQRSRIYENMGITSLRSNNYNRAIADFNKALRLNENSIVANKELATLYLQNSQADLALQHYQIFIDNQLKPTIDDYKLGIKIAENNNLTLYANKLEAKLNSLLIK